MCNDRITNPVNWKLEFREITKIFSFFLCLAQDHYGGVLALTEKQNFEVQVKEAEDLVKTNAKNKC